MVVGVGFCKIKVDNNFLLVLKIKCTKFHQDRSKTVDLHTKFTDIQFYIQVAQNWRTNYLLPYRGCLNVHEKNMEKMFPTKKLIIFIIIINGNTM
jgi:beta-galactosidase beta subunit